MTYSILDILNRKAFRNANISEKDLSPQQTKSLVDLYNSGYKSVEDMKLCYYLYSLEVSDIYTIFLKYRNFKGDKKRKDSLIEIFGYDLGIHIYQTRSNHIKEKIRKDKTKIEILFSYNAFMNKNITVNTLTNKQVDRLEYLLNHFEPSSIRDMSNSICSMIEHNLTNYYGRIKRLKNMPASPNKLAFVLRYGKKEGLKKYNETCISRTQHLKNKVEYWSSCGKTIDEAVFEISKIQTARAKKASNKLKGSNGLYSIRSVKYWISKGLTMYEANEKVKSIQTKNGIKWYTQKYGEQIGKELYNDRIERWLFSYYNNNDIIEINKKKGVSKQQQIEKYGIEEYIKKHRNRTTKMIDTMIKRGIWTAPNKKEEKLQYYAEVSYYTRFSLSLFYNKINPKNHKIGLHHYHIDHKYSKHQGFMNNIPSHVIGSYVNLETLWCKDNLKKYISCTITKDELLEEFLKIEDEYIKLLEGVKKYVD